MDDFQRWLFTLVLSAFSALVAFVVTVLSYAFRNSVMKRLDAHAADIRGLREEKISRPELERCLDRIEETAKTDRHDLKDFLQTWVMNMESRLGSIEGKVETKLNDIEARVERNLKHIEQRLWNGRKT